jgi:hypothetical protein
MYAESDWNEIFITKQAYWRLQEGESWALSLKLLM